jgi:phospholipase/carboxylesterase
MAAILGYSGMLIGEDRIAGDIVSRPPVQLIHGEADDVIPVAAIHQARDALEKAGVSVKWHTCPGLSHGIDGDGLNLGGQFLADAFATHG